VWKVCVSCRVGSINQISITVDYQRQGLGRRLIRRALVDGPGYRWHVDFPYAFTRRQAITPL
jgi:hypothetical protein